MEVTVLAKRYFYKDGKHSQLDCDKAKLVHHDKGKV